MDEKDYKVLLGFSDQWLSLGILTDDDLQRYGTAYETSDDKNAEHFRYGTFQRYLKKHRPLSTAMAEALYKLGASDPDGMMGGAMMSDVLGLPECPTSVLEQALTSGQKHLVGLAERRRLLSELAQGSLTEELFSQCIGSRDDVVASCIVEARQPDSAAVADAHRARGKSCGA